MDFLSKINKDSNTPIITTNKKVIKKNKLISIPETIQKKLANNPQYNTQYHNINSRKLWSFIKSELLRNKTILEYVNKATFTSLSFEINIIRILFERNVEIRIKIIKSNTVIMTVINAHNIQIFYTTNSIIDIVD